MKISVYTFPFRGHTLQATKIANYLSSKGHKVMFDTHPDFFKYLSKEIIKKETLYTYLTPQDNIDKDTLLNCAEGILLTSKNYLQDFENSCEKPDLIIFDSMAYWGKLIANKYNINSVSLITIQPFTHQNFIDYSYKYLNTYSSAFKSPQMFLRSLHIFQEIVKKKYNLPNNFVFDDILCATGKSNLVLMPKSICKFSKDLNDSYKLFSPIIDYDKKDIKKEKSVYLATGSIINDLDFLQKCINTLLSLNIKVYVSAGKFASKLNNIYIDCKNIYVYEFAPQMEILEKCSVFITHGGSNSICEAIYCEAPMIVIPFTNDEFINADMVEELGIGIKINNFEKEISNLSHHVKTILTNKQLKERIKKVNKEINSNNFKTIIDKIIEVKNGY